MKKLILLILLFASTIFAGWEIVEDEMRLLSPDGTEVMKMYRDIDNTNVYMNWTLGDLFMQGGDVNLEINNLTTTGTLTAEDVLVNSLDPSTSVYTDALKKLTSTAPSTGTVGFWTRTETPDVLTTATAGDGILTTGTITGGTLTDGTASLTGGNLTSMGNITGSDVDITVGTGSYVSTSGNLTIGGSSLLGDGVTDTHAITGVTSIGDGGTTDYMSFTAAGIQQLNGAAGIVLPHLMQSDSTTQAVATANIAQKITFDTDVHHSL